MAPNSRAFRKRPAGIWACCARGPLASFLPVLVAAACIVVARRSSVELAGQQVVDGHALRAMPLRAARPQKPVRPLRAPLTGPTHQSGAFTALEVMLITRPKPDAAIPSTVALISSMGVGMLASTALIPRRDPNRGSRLERATGIGHDDIRSHDLGHPQQQTTAGSTAFQGW